MRSSAPNASCPPSRRSSSACATTKTVPSTTLPSSSACARAPSARIFSAPCTKFVKNWPAGSTENRTTAMTTPIKHYSEAELLETYYMQPDQAMPVMQHLRTCDDCIARYNRLEQKLRAAAACPTKPATFWSFQRGSIMRRVDAQRRSATSAARTWRVAAAAVLAFFLGGAVVYETVKPLPPAPAVAAVQAPVASV